MKEWFTLPELSAQPLPDLPATARGLTKLAERDGWRHLDGKARRAQRQGGGWEYHVSVLPAAAQARLMMLFSAPANDDRDLIAEKSAALWARFEALPTAQKAAAETRLKAVQHAFELEFQGHKTAAAAAIAAHAAGVSVRSVFNWQATCQANKRGDWLPALASEYRNEKDFSPIDPEAWDVLKSDFLRLEGPSFSSCYRRVKEASKKRQWGAIPDERSLRRRLDKEVPKAVQVLARKGKDKAKTLYPAQRRSRAHLSAMQMVNMDGHKLDVWIKTPWAQIPVRIHLVVIQDLYSGKIVAWRLSDTENKETVRLVIGDMVEVFGIPDDIYLDNGRAFASKWISGGSPTRFRFKVGKDDPQGLITALQIKPHWTTPYSGQSKPIERAFRDLADNISKHPFCAGAYTGNKPDAKPENYASRAIPLDRFHAHVAHEIALHNAQASRSAANCAGRSFDETFAASIADPSNVGRWPSEAQKSLWLMASEAITTRKGSGEIHYLGTRYWASALNQIAGSKVIIRFDPDNLAKPVKVYDLQNRLICEAPAIADVKFDDVGAAREHARDRRELAKATQIVKDIHVKWSPERLGEFYAPPAAPQAMQEPVRTKVTRVVTGGAQAPAAVVDDAFNDSFSRALARISGSADVIQFPAQTGDEPKSSAYGSKK
jgi:putative transposase